MYLLNFGLVQFANLFEHWQKGRAQTDTWTSFLLGFLLKFLGLIKIVRGPGVHYGFINCSNSLALTYTYTNLKYAVIKSGARIVLLILEHLKVNFHMFTSPIPV